MSVTSVQDEPSYCSVFQHDKLDQEPPPKTKPCGCSSTCICSTNHLFFLVFKAPPLAQVAPGKSNIVSLKVFAVELKNNCPSLFL